MFLFGGRDVDCGTHWGIHDEEGWARFVLRHGDDGEKISGGGGVRMREGRGQCSPHPLPTSTGISFRSAFLVHPQQRSIDTRALHYRMANIVIILRIPAIAITTATLTHVNTSMPIPLCVEF